MPKFYVKSGTLEVILSRKDSLEASIAGFVTWSIISVKVLSKNKPPCLG